jgi:hypothetical protein
MQRERERERERDSRTMEDLQCDLVPEEEATSDTDKCRFQNDVLRLRMGMFVG